MGSNSAAKEARRARHEEEEREARIQRGSVDIRDQFAKQFNQQYYNDALKAQKDAYKPEFETQWEIARKGLETALMRAGIYDSTEGVKRRADALETKGRREEDINQRALSAVQGRRSSIQAAEDTVLGQLRSSGDDMAANAAAAQQLSMQSAPIPFSPLGAVFQDFTAGLAEQANQERQGTNRYNLGISQWANPNRYTRTVKG